MKVHINNLYRNLSEVIPYNGDNLVEDFAYFITTKPENIESQSIYKLDLDIDPTQLKILLLVMDPNCALTLKEDDFIPIIRLMGKLSCINNFIKIIIMERIVTFYNDLSLDASSFCEELCQHNANKILPDTFIQRLVFYKRPRDFLSRGTTGVGFVLLFSPNRGSPYASDGIDCFELYYSYTKVVDDFLVLKAAVFLPMAATYSLHFQIFCLNPQFFGSIKSDCCFTHRIEVRKIKDKLFKIFHFECGTDFTSFGSNVFVCRFNA